MLRLLFVQDFLPRKLDQKIPTYPKIIHKYFNPFKSTPSKTLLVSLFYVCPYLDTRPTSVTPLERQEVVLLLFWSVPSV